MFISTNGVAFYFSDVTKRLFILHGHFQVFNSFVYHFCTALVIPQPLPRSDALIIQLFCIELNWSAFVRIAYFRSRLWRLVLWVFLLEILKATNFVFEIDAELRTQCALVVAVERHIVLWNRYWSEQSSSSLIFQDF